jgi:hypothetical protein
MDSAYARVQQQGLPSSPYRKVDSASIGNLVAISPLDLYPSDEPWMAPTIQALWEQSVEQDMFFQRIVHTGLNAYLSIQLARAMLASGDGRWLRLFHATLTHASPTWTWPEAIHPRTGGGCMGDGDHGWAAAEVLSFMLSILVRVQAGKLLLGVGLPNHWYQSEMDVQVKNASTRFGTVSWRLQGKGDRALLRWKIERNVLQKKATAYFGLPMPFGLASPRLTTTYQGHHVIILDSDLGELEIPLRR